MHHLLTMVSILSIIITSISIHIIQHIILTYIYRYYSNISRSCSMYISY